MSYLHFFQRWILSLHPFYGLKDKIYDGNGKSLEGKELIVKEAMEKAGLEVLEITSQGEWKSVTARKN